MVNDEKVLIEKIIAGDTNSFRVIVNNYKRLVSHIIFGMVKNETDREDVCQEVFIKAYKNISTFKFNSKFSTWIGRIAYNTGINYIKKKKLTLYEDQITETEASREENYTDSIWTNFTAPDKVVDKKLISDYIRSEISKLPDKYRMILTLFHIDELNYKEIGQIMDQPEGTLKSLLFRARRLLKEKLLSKYKLEEICG